MQIIDNFDMTACEVLVNLIEEKIKQIRTPVFDERLNFSKSKMMKEALRDCLGDGDNSITLESLGIKDMGMAIPDAPDKLEIVIKYNKILDELRRAIANPSKHYKENYLDND